VRIETEAACRTAAAAACKTLGGSRLGDFVMTDPTNPRGCFYWVNDAYFNTDAVGSSSDPYALLLCAVTGARVPNR
jgi:hypothetical protein